MLMKSLLAASLSINANTLRHVCFSKMAYKYLLKWRPHWNIFVIEHMLLTHFQFVFLLWTSIICFREFKMLFWYIFFHFEKIIFMLLKIHWITRRFHILKMWMNDPQQIYLFPLLLFNRNRNECDHGLLQTPLSNTKRFLE